MEWSIHRICPREESVFLQNLNSGVIRQVSVPGAESATIEGDNLVIHAKTGFSWLVNPATGARRRLETGK